NIVFSPLSLHDALPIFVEPAPVDRIERRYNLGDRLLAGASAPGDGLLQDVGADFRQGHAPAGADSFHEAPHAPERLDGAEPGLRSESTRLNSSHLVISY